jgi:putative tryptophan/tyrosine transport system substrate-binding protein
LDANDHYDRLPPLARELATDRVTAILTIGVAARLAAKAATSTIPVVFMIGFDPVEFGLVSSRNPRRAARDSKFLSSMPATTGVAVLSNTLEPKQLQLLHVTIFDETSIA